MDLSIKEFEISKAYLTENQIFLQSNTTKKVYQYLESILNTGNNPVIESINKIAASPAKNKPATKSRDTVKRNIKFDTQKFHKAISPRRSALPILSYFAVNNGMQISTDLEIYGYTKTDLTPGIYEYIDKDIVNRSGIDFTVDDFPMSDLEIEKNCEVYSISIPRESLSAIKRCLSFASRDELRLSMNAIYFDIRENELKIIGTDAHRLSKNTFQIESNIKDTLIIPLKGLEVLTRFNDSAFTLTVYNPYKTNQHNITGLTGDKFATFETSEFKIYTRIKNDCIYPQYESVIPGYYTSYIMFDRDELLDAAKNCINYADTVTNKIIFQRRGRDTFRISASNKDKELHKSIDVYCNVPEFTRKHRHDKYLFDFAFNGKYLIDVLQHIKPGAIHMKHIHPEKQFIVSGRELVNNDNISLLMPIKNI